MGDFSLPLARFDGVFAIDVLPHIPSECLESVLARIFSTLRPGGVLMMQVIHSKSGKAEEFWCNAFTNRTHSWLCNLPEASWHQHCKAAGFELLKHTRDDSPSQL